MTLIDTVTALSERFLRERTFELVVAPAIADVQYDAGRARGLRRARHGTALLAAFAWGVYEDLTSDSSALTFAALVVIPACYYTFLVIVCAPPTRAFSTTSGRLMLAGVIAVLSFGPAIACYWPERPARRLSAEG